MSLNYSRESIPPAERCTSCGGDGDEWTQTGPDEFTPTGECRTCHGSGRRSGLPVHPRHLEVVPPTDDDELPF